MAALEQQLAEAQKALVDYANDLEPITNDHTALLKQTDALHRMMEAVFQYHLTF